MSFIPAAADLLQQFTVDTRRDPTFVRCCDVRQIYKQTDGDFEINSRLPDRQSFQKATPPSTKSTRPAAPAKQITDCCCCED